MKRTDNNNPQVNQKIEISIWDEHTGRTNHIVTIIKKRVDFWTQFNTMVYLCEYENLERKWHSHDLFVRIVK